MLKNLKRYLFIVIVLFTSCRQKPVLPAYTYLYGYGQVEKLNGRVKTLTEEKHIGDIYVFAYVFNGRGDLVETRSSGSGNVNKYNTQYSNGIKKVARGVYFENEKKFEETYVYDKHGLITQFIANTNNLSPDTDRFFFDTTGNLIEHQQYFEKKPIWIFKYRYLYNKSALCSGVEQSMTTWRDDFKTPDKDTTRYITFDSHNNWLKSVDVLNDTTIRKIIYY